MRGNARSFSEALQRLGVKASKGRPAPTSPKELSLGAIREEPQVFQHRETPQHWSAAHARGLVDAIQRKGGKPLAPITVWWAGRNWVCIDGHHRMMAYRKSLTPDTLVPVDVFIGTLDEALAQAAAGNTHDKLPMSTPEKTRAAWRLVCTTDLSRADIAQACGVGDGTVANMRRVFRALGSTVDCADKSWHAARREAQGLQPYESPEFDEAKQRQTAEAWALQIRKVLPKGFEKQLDTFRMALETLHPRLLPALREEWAAGEDESEDDTGDEDE